MVLVWPNWFGLDHNDLVSTKMKWSRPKWIGQVQMWFILVKNHDFDLTNSFWLWPFHFGRDQIIMVKSKSIWSDKTILDRPKLFWSHRRTRHKSGFCPANLGVRSCPVRKLICPVRSSPTVYLPSISILIIIFSILIFKYWYWYFLFQKRTEILILQYYFIRQYQYFSIFLKWSGNYVWSY